MVRKVNKHLFMGKIQGRRVVLQRLRSIYAVSAWVEGIGSIGHFPGLRSAMKGIREKLRKNNNLNKNA